MMNLYGLSMALIVLSTAGYHFAQRATSIKINPAFTLMVSYLLAAMVTGAIYFVGARPIALAAMWGQIKWPTYILALSIVGIEMGTLFAYRAGWSLGTTALFAHIAVTLVLLPLSYFLLHDRYHWANIVGVCLAIVGIFLMQIGRG